jgi:hypothetical protein
MGQTKPQGVCREYQLAHARLAGSCKDPVAEQHNPDRCTCHNSEERRVCCYTIHASGPAVWPGNEEPVDRILLEPVEGLDSPRIDTLQVDGVALRGEALGIAHVYILPLEDGRKTEVLSVDHLGNTLLSGEAHSEREEVGTLGAWDEEDCGSDGAPMVDTLLPEHIEQEVRVCKAHHGKMVERLVEDDDPWDSRLEDFPVCVGAAHTYDDHQRFYDDCILQRHVYHSLQ